MAGRTPQIARMARLEFRGRGALMVIASLLLLTTAGVGVLASPAAAAQAPIFSPKSFWNTPLDSTARLDPSSPALVGSLLRGGEQRALPPLRPVDQHQGIQHPDLHGRAELSRRVSVTLDRDLHRHAEGDRRRPDPAGRQARRRHRQAHGRLAAGHGHDVGVLEDGDAPRRLARGRRRGDAPRLDQPRLLHPGCLARRPALVGSDGDRAAAPRRIDDDRRAAARTHRPCLAMAIPHSRAGVWSWPATHGDGDSQTPERTSRGCPVEARPGTQPRRSSTCPR